MFRIHSLTKAILSALPVVALTNPLPARAQDNLRTDSGLEEITVTATRRATNLQDTPLAISAFSMDDLDSVNIRTPEDLAGVVPGLNIGISTGNVMITMRGVGSDNIFVAAGSGVAFHTDGVFLGRQTGGNVTFMDLERVEVLKGPQGTLYGRNATGGAINVISAKPTNALEGYAGTTVGSLNRISTRGAINVPVVDDKFAIRASFMTDSADGYFDNGPLVSANYNDRDERALRLHALYTPTTDSSLLFTYQLAERGGVGESAQIVPRDSLPSDLANPYYLPMNTDGDRDDDSTLFKIELDQSLSFGSLKYIGAYMDAFTHAITDFDRTDTTTNIYDYMIDNDQLSHEIQLASHDEGPLKWLFGAFYFDESVFRRLYTETTAAAGLTQSYGFTPDFNSKSTALFGQVTYSLSEDWRLTLGLRRSLDEKSEFGTSSRRVTPTGETFAEADGYGKWGSTDWKIGLDWDAFSDTLFYASVSTGFKSGGFNDPLLALSNPVFGPEEVLAYQFGHKSRFRDGRVQLNTEAFLYYYDGLQTTQSENGVSVTRNAADATIRGIDFDTQFSLSDATQLTWQATFLDATYGAFFAFESLWAQTVDLTGSRMLRAPRVSSRLALRHEFSLRNGLSLTPQISTVYESDTKLRVFDDPGAVQTAYTRTDASVLIEPASKRWSVQPFVSNLEDDVVWNFGLIVGGNRRALSPRAPRAFGAHFVMNF